MLSAKIFLETVIQPTLDLLGLGGAQAEELLLGTAIQESGLRWRKQIGGGPGLGLYQMEPLTHQDLWHNYLIHKTTLATKVMSLIKETSWRDSLTNNDAYATAMARVYYLRIPKPLPAAGDVEGQAAYWKKYYNTLKGKGTPEQYVASWGKVVEHGFTTDDPSQLPGG